MNDIDQTALDLVNKLSAIRICGRGAPVAQVTAKQQIAVTDAIKSYTNDLLKQIQSDLLAGIDEDLPEDMVVATKACCVDLWKYRYKTGETQ